MYLYMYIYKYEYIEHFGTKDYIILEQDPRCSKKKKNFIIINLRYPQLYNYNLYEVLINMLYEI